MAHCVVSDHHFGHANVIDYCEGPFASVGEMDAALLDRHYETVGEDDVLVHLGDVAMDVRDGRETIERFRTVDGDVLVRGNHDVGLDRADAPFPVLESCVLERDGSRFHCTRRPEDAPTDGRAGSVRPAPSRNPLACGGRIPTMFTGIVEGTGEVVRVADEAGGRRLSIRAPFSDVHEGQSIAVGGVCLTVEGYEIHDEGDADDSGVVRADGPDAARGAATFEVFLAAETVARTYLGDLVEGDLVNVERALPADGRFDGHLVQGHVDTTVAVTGIERVGDDWRFAFELPGDVARYVVEKGSVTLDGISLTVADRSDDGFAVAIIPTTYDVTTLSEKAVGDPVHLEVDVVAKYVENMLEGYAERLVE
jgi:riboflavin synthase